MDFGQMEKILRRGPAPCVTNTQHEINLKVSRVLSVTVSAAGFPVLVGGVAAVLGTICWTQSRGGLVSYTFRK